MFDVQLMGGIVLHEGDIAEMKTGEGKTFVASAPLYLNALAGTGVHLVTVNDYLAKRDAEWNRGVFERLGMTVGARFGKAARWRRTSSPGPVLHLGDVALSAGRDAAHQLHVEHPLIRLPEARLAHGRE